MQILSGRMSPEPRNTNRMRMTTRPRASSRDARRRMQVTRRRDTRCEQALQTAVRKLGLRFRVDWRLPGTRRRADLAFVRARVAVFVDGCFWHCCPIHATRPRANAAWWRQKLADNVARDRDTNTQLRGKGWSAIRFWEHEDPARSALKIAALLKKNYESATRKDL